MNTVLLVTALALDPSGYATITGAIETQHDGARFDATSWFDAGAGGLRVAVREGDRVILEPTGGVGAACAAAGVASPCLVPRVTDHAHARLLSVAEFAATLRGGFEVTTHVPPPPPSRTPLIAALALSAAAIVSLLLAIRARLRATPLGRVQAASRVARRAVANDPTLAVLRDEIDRLVDHARDVDRIRASCEATLARFGVADRHAAEREEELRLRDDLARANARLRDIAAALRLVPLRVREARNVRFDGSPVDAILAELTLRDHAMAEASR